MNTGETGDLPIVNAQAVEQLIAGLDPSPAGEKELKNILSLVDLTSLEGKDTDAQIEALCAKAMRVGTAAVCVYPSLVAVAKRALKGSGIRSASVAGAFPSGQSALSVRLEEVRFAIGEGADEIDMVISRGKFLEGNYNFVFDEVAAFKELCKEVTLKVILETGELERLDLIRKASDIALRAGADFIKTSTGKISVNATLPAVCVMMEAIKEHHAKTGKRCGIKPSGGIADGDTAALYTRLGEKILGKEQLNPSLFRFGASRLVDNVIAQLEGKNVSANSDKSKGY